MPVIGYCRNLYNNLCPCFVCWKKFSLDNGIEDLLTHICFTHRIIIENTDRIADFKKYMEYYGRRCRETAIENFTKPVTIEIPEKDAEPKEQTYFFLGDFVPEDECLRKNLHTKRLKAAQKQQKKDLSEKIFIRHCFYCHQTIRVTNAHLIIHLRSHGFQLGHPEKLVYIENFVESIEDTFRTLHCLYCDTKFESCRALVSHMQEKNHMKIHPNNRFYDQFYMINYVEFGKTWMDFLKEKNKLECEHDHDDATADGEATTANQVDDDQDWSSWGTEPESIMCLFCKHICRSWDGTLLHMLVSHNFDFKARISHLTFYQQVKVVNYIRRRVSDNACINCETQFDNSTDLISHMERNHHLSIPSKERWNHSDYFYCTMENDMFLYHLEDEDEKEDIAATTTTTVHHQCLMLPENARSSFSDKSNSPSSDVQNEIGAEHECLQAGLDKDNRTEHIETAQATDESAKNCLSVSRQPITNGVECSLGGGDSIQSKVDTTVTTTATSAATSAANKQIGEFGDGGSTKNII